MSRAKTLSRCIAPVLAAAVLAQSRPARADDAAGGAGFILFSLVQLVPGEVGVDRALASDAAPRFSFGWVNQIPLGLFAFHQTDDEWVREASPLWRHRVVLSLTLAWGFTGAGPARSLDVLGADFCVRYRYRFRHRRAIAPYLGFGGGTGDSAYLSPELGLHFGRDGVGRPGVQLGLEGRAFFDGTPPRVEAVAAWTLW